jgi:hypothetical protein
MATGQTRYAHDVLRVPALHKDGHSLSIAFTVAMLFAEDKSVASVVAVVRDETARWTEDRALRKRLGELESKLAESNPSSGPNRDPAVQSETQPTACKGRWTVEQAA